MTDTKTTSTFKPGDTVAVVGNTANKSAFAGWIGRVNHCHEGEMGQTVSVDFDHNVYGKHLDVPLFPHELERIEQIVNDDGVIEILDTATLECECGHRFVEKDLVFPLYLLDDDYADYGGDCPECGANSLTGGITEIA